MRLHLDRNQGNEFSLVSGAGAPDLEQLCASARKSVGDPEEFYQYQVQKIGGTRSDAYTQFCRYLGLDYSLTSDRAQAYGYLRRVYIECWPDNVTSSEDLMGYANALVAGDPATVVAVLADFAQQNLRKPITAPAVWQHLVSHGFHPRRLTNDSRVMPAVEELRRRFADSIKPDLIAGEIIRRRETGDILNALNDGDIVVLHGSPGEGKSGVLYELTQRLQEENRVFLPVRLDRHEPRNTPQQFGQDLGLPESPVTCLEAVAGAQPAVLILDQLDAIRWTSRHSLNALGVCKALVREAMSFRDLGRQIGVVLACRTYDLENDPEIKSWLSSQGTEHKLVRIRVALLEEGVVADVVGKQGHTVCGLSQRQRQILQSPQHLAMWVRLVQSGVAPDFQNRVQLMREFWESRLRELPRNGVPVESANALLTTLIDYLERNGRVSAPRSLVTDSTVLDVICACGLLQVEGSQITFTHQSHLDFQIASRVVRQIHRGSGGVRGWLGGRETQSLFRREQLRQALFLLHDESSQDFVETAAALLDDNDVRFHLKHLILEVIGQCGPRDSRVIELMKGMAEKEPWREHVFGTVFLGHPLVIGRLLDDGTISRWLESDEWRDWALWMLRSVSQNMPDEVASALAPYAGLGDGEWRRRILGCLCWKAEDDSDRMFDLRLELARSGTFRELVGWDKLAHGRALRLLEAIVSSWTSDDPCQDRSESPATRPGRSEHWTKPESEALVFAARELPQQTWEVLIPQICRLAPPAGAPANAMEEWVDGDPHAVRAGAECLPHGLFRLAVEAGRKLAINDSKAFWDRTGELRTHESPVIQCLLVETYSALSAECADLAVRWLLGDPARLDIGTGTNEPEWMPAARLIEALSPHCSEAVFRRLEEALIHYHTPRERRDAKYWLSTWKRGYFGDFWGRAQYFLLPALCSARCRDEAKGLIGVLNRKFEGYPRESFYRAGGAHFGSVVSTLPSQSLERISDAAWLRILANKEIPTDRGRLDRWVDGHWEESSVIQFSQNLENVARRYPDRFARLALKLPEDVHSDYKAAILSGCQHGEPNAVPEAERALWRPASVHLLEEVLHKFGRDDSRSYALQFCWLMQARANETWPAAAIDRLLDYARNHPDPEPEGMVIGNVGGGFDLAKATVETLCNNSLNCVRGAAAFAVAAQLRCHTDLLPTFKGAIARMVQDPHPAVRIAAIGAAHPVLWIDKDLAIEWFIEACTGDLRVAASPDSADYFNCGMKTHHSTLAPLVRVMLHSSYEEVAQRGATEVAARWLFHGSFSGELETCLREGTISHRKGVAYVAARLVTEPEYFDKCAALIDRLKGDADREVRRHLSAAFRNAEVLRMPNGVDLARRFVNSEAFRDDPTSLIFSLEGYAGDLLPFAGIIFAMCDEFAGSLREASRDPSGGVMWDVSQFVPMMMRLYEQANEHKDIDAVNRCLDAWDVMFEKRVGVVHELAKAID